MWQDLLDLLWQAYEQFGFLPLFIQVSFSLIIFAILGTILAYSSIFYKRYQGYVTEKRLNFITPKIEDMITEQVLLNEKLSMGTPVDEIEFDPVPLSDKIYKKKWVRQVLIDILIQYRKNFRGDVGELLRKLYIDMELAKDSFAKLSTMKWDRKIKGVMELTQMDVPISDVTILPMTNSQNPLLRAVSRNAYIQLSKNEPFKFFDIATEPLLPWDQLEMFRIITTTKDIMIPNFSRWISYSTNKSIVAFCLKLIAHYDQKTAIPAVMDLLNNKDHYFRAEAIACLGKLSAEIAEIRLIKIYEHQPMICQIEILRATGLIASGKYLDFLKHELMYSTNFEIRMNATRAIINHDSDESRTIIKEIMNTTYEENRVIIKHCLNPLIKY